MGQQLTDSVWQKLNEGRAQCPKPEIYDWVYSFLVVHNYDNIHDYVTVKSDASQAARPQDRVHVVKIPDNPFNDQYLVEQSMIHVYSVLGVLMGMQEEVTRLTVFAAMHADLCFICFQKAQPESECPYCTRKFCSSACKSKHKCS